MLGQLAAPNSTVSIAEAIKKKSVRFLKAKQHFHTGKLGFGNLNFLPASNLVPNPVGLRRHQPTREAQFSSLQPPQLVPLDMEQQWLYTEHRHVAEQIYKAEIMHSKSFLGLFCTVRVEGCIIETSQLNTNIFVKMLKFGFSFCFKRCFVKCDCLHQRSCLQSFFFLSAGLGTWYYCRVQLESPGPPSGWDAKMLGFTRLKTKTWPESSRTTHHQERRRPLDPSVKQILYPPESEDFFYDVISPKPFSQLDEKGCFHAGLSDEKIK